MKNWIVGLCVVVACLIFTPEAQASGGGGGFALFPARRLAQQQFRFGAPVQRVVVAAPTQRIIVSQPQTLLLQPQAVQVQRVIVPQQQVILRSQTIVLH